MAIAVKNTIQVRSRCHFWDLGSMGTVGLEFLEINVGWYPYCLR